MRGGRIIVLSGPGGVGKDTVIEALRQRHPQLGYSVSYTTRPARPYEREGVHYRFVTGPRFQSLLESGDMLEHALINGYHYGTSAQLVNEQLEQGRDVILKIDVQGAEQMRRSRPDALFIFLKPPSMNELLRRRRARDSESAAEMEARQRLAVEEMGNAAAYDHVIVNDELDQTVAAIESILAAGAGDQRGPL
ncbi:MAG TPA: guanylate kinase [Candidatus Acidoferrales bacterium]|nr:guanylate kinase [Candidatus Acidoferrales bacterium]